MGKSVATTSASFKAILPAEPERAVSITRSEITKLMMESYKKADNSSEEIAALREVAKLNDLYPTATRKVELDITHHEKTLKELEGMSTAELLQLAGDASDLLSLPDPIEGEYEEIKEEEEEGLNGQGIRITAPIELESV